MLGHAFHLADWTCVEGRKFFAERTGLFHKKIEDTRGNEPRKPANTGGLSCYVSTTIRELSERNIQREVPEVKGVRFVYHVDYEEGGKKGEAEEEGNEK